MPKAIEMDKAFDQAFSRPEAPSKDYARAMGEGLLESVMGGIAERAKAGLLAGADHEDGKDDLDATLGRLLKYRMLMGLFGDDKQTDTGTATVMKAVIDSTTNMTRFMAELQAKSDERFAALLKELREDQRMQWERLRDEADRAKQGDEFASLGKQFLMQQLSTDPKEAYARQRQQFWEEFQREHGDTKVVDLEQWKAEQEFELRREELKARREEERERAERQNQILAGVLSAVRPGSAASGPSPVPEGGNPAAAGLARYRCAQCDQEFVLRQPAAPGATLTCPHCQGLIQVTAPAPAAPAEDVAVGGMPFEEDEG